MPAADEDRGPPATREQLAALAASISESDRVVREAQSELQSLLLDVVQFVIQCDDYTGNDTKQEVKCSRDSWRSLPGWRIKNHSTE